MGDDSKNGSNPVVDWIKGNVSSVFRHMKEDKFEKQFSTADNTGLVDDFLTNPDVRVLVFSDNS